MKFFIGYEKDRMARLHGYQVKFNTEAGWVEDVRYFQEVRDDETKDDKYYTVKSRSHITQYLESTYQLWQSIKSGNDANSYLNCYSQELTDNYPDLTDLNSAITKLRACSGDYYGHVIKALLEAGLDCWIGGSSVLNAVTASANWQPNDIDLYIKDITNAKICEIDTAIRRCTFELKPHCHILIVRKPITINWVIFDDYGEPLLIQLNLLRISSWAELMSVYHADHVCIGYEIQSNRILYLTERWERYLKCRYQLSDHPVFYSNFLNLDTPITLFNACRKYEKKREIEGRCLFKWGYIKEDRGESLSQTDYYIYRGGQPHLFDFISNLCHSADFVISSRIEDTLLDMPENCTPRITDLRDLMTDPQYQDFRECPQTLQQEMIANQLSSLLDSSDYYSRLLSVDAITDYSLSRFYLVWVLALYGYEYDRDVYLEIHRHIFYARNPIRGIIGLNSKEREIAIKVKKYYSRLDQKLKHRRHLIGTVLGQHRRLYKDVISSIMAFV